MQKNRLKPKLTQNQPYCSHYCSHFHTHITAKDPRTIT
nr:MAG TPA: hypothetical protein [Caudoviricetes sp.]